ncbi:AbrB/MazE/SpoVT family DNA-binding domain-containing protein [Thermaerobacter marianensis]|nr:AbrB/MazE/SpoVT family DNA-binding domain-containing protein [Thermaerobacter marianensis]
MATGQVIGPARVQAEGRLQIPAALLEALGIRPGDGLLFEAVGPDEGRFWVIRSQPLEEFFDRHRIDEPVPERLWETAVDDMVRDVMGRNVGGGDADSAVDRGEKP